MGRPKIIVKASNNRQTFVSVVGGNGKKIANTETYKTHGGAMQSAYRLKDIIKGSQVVDRTKKIS